MLSSETGIPGSNSSLRTNTCAELSLMIAWDVSPPITTKQQSIVEITCETI